MQPFFAFIVPMGGGDGSPPGIWGPTDPRPGWGLPGGGGGGGGGGGSPPGTWGGAGEPFPGYGLPGRPPGHWGGGSEGFPTPPIVIPPQQPGQPPLVIWGGGNVPMPTPPIELPGGGNPPPGGEPVKLIEWKTAWSPDTGWVVVGIPQAPHPAPSAAKK